MEDDFSKSHDKRRRVFYESLLRNLISAIVHLAIAKNLKCFKNFDFENLTIDLMSFFKKLASSFFFED